MYTENPHKAIIGGIVAAVIVSGDTVSDTDMCEGINCGIGGNCTGGNCTCQTGFVNVENFCEDMCEGINCGPGGVCLNGICNCQTDYVHAEKFVRKHVHLSPVRN